MSQKIKAFIFPIFILSIVTVYTMLSLFYPEKVAFNFKKTNRELLQAGQTKVSRQIASSDEIPPLILSCLNLENKIQVTTSEVLIKFQDCDDQKQISDFKLVNLTNSYMAQIFHPTVNVIATDFIQLAKGENILNLEISLNDKHKKTQIIKIERISTEIQ